MGTEHTDKLLDRVSRHYAGHWGRGEVRGWPLGPAEALGAGFHVEVFPPTAGRSVWIHATRGMCMQASSPRLELYVMSQVDELLITELLYAVAHYHATGARLGVNHIVSFGRSWMEGSRCDHGFISIPYIHGPQLEWCRGEGEDVRVLWLLPITRPERRYALEHGVEALEERLEQEKVEYANPSRASVV